MSGSMRDLILDATERLLGRLGYQKTTMEDIAREACIGKRTIYLHFAGKEEVALSSIDRIVERLMTRLREIAASGDAPADQIRRMLAERVLFRFDSVHDYYHGLDELFQSLRPAYMARRERYFAQEAALFAAVLEAGRAAGVFACDDPVATANTLLLATNALLPSGMSARELGVREDVAARVDRIANLLLYGVCRRRKAPVRPGRRRTDVINS
jgi:AcrR family transcriptional regulator